MKNINELILERVRFVNYHDLSTGRILFRLTQLEDSSLTTTAESDVVTDALGSPITTMYRAKAGTYSATNSLFSLGLAANQFGTEVQYGTATNKLLDYASEVLTIPTGGEITLANKAVTDNIKYIYTIEEGQLSSYYEAGAAVSATEFVVDNSGATTKIQVPTGLTGKVYVEYEYENENVALVSNMASNFPTAGKLVIFAYFKDVCNENKVYSGKIICPKAKIDPSQVELALTSTGKHPFTFNLNVDYCASEGENKLFDIVVSE